MRRMKMIMCVVAVVCSFMAIGQTKVDELRMEQDIEIAENILSTLARQQAGKRNFFPTEVNGSYTAGYGITFRMPLGGPFNAFMFNSFDAPDMEIVTPDGSFSYYSYSGDDDEDCVDCEKVKAKIARGAAEQDKARAEQSRARVQGMKRKTTIARAPKPPGVENNSIGDSVSASAYKRFQDIAKSFLADYGDVISQLKPEERIIITNRTEEFNSFGFNRWPGETKRSMISVEAKREDIIQLKQGKITRDQFLKKLVILNSEPSDKLDPDLEVLSSMFNRLYQEDLSKTYYTQGDVGYDRLKDFGVIYYMKVYSSIETDGDRFAIPAIAMMNVSQPERDKKVKELYPAFEADLKNNLLEYGRTLRSLKDEEQVVINVKLTRCVGCGIPGTLELSVKNSVLKDYSSGKVTKEAALAKVGVKKVGVQ